MNCHLPVSLLQCNAPLMSPGTFRSEGLPLLSPLNVQGDEIPAVSKDKEDEAAVSGVRISELADPPLCLGNVKDLETGRALLLSIGMKKVMPRPSG